ncbi:hypothetical protein L9F63_023293, partial [Diploptera punctata]
VTAAFTPRTYVFDSFPLELSRPMFMVSAEEHTLYMKQINNDTCRVRQMALARNARRGCKLEPRGSRDLYPSLPTNVEKRLNSVQFTDIRKRTAQ